MQDVPVRRREADDDQVRRLRAFVERHPGSSYLCPSTPDHPWELRVPEPDGYRRVLLEWKVGALMDKAEKHYPEADEAEPRG